MPAEDRSAAQGRDIRPLEELPLYEKKDDQAAATTERPLWQRFQEAAQAAAASAAQCLNDCDFDSAAYYRGRAGAFRDAEVLARGFRRAA